jgi:ribosomal protein S18 acetylase RimI-like enzyme
MMLIGMKNINFFWANNILYSIQSIFFLAIIDAMIRTINSNDYSQIYQISIQIFPKEEYNDFTKSINNYIPELSYVILDEINVIGFILVCNKQTTVKWVHLDNIEGYEISFFGISPSYQGRGLGKLLLNYTLNNIFKKYSICWLSVDIKNTYAIQMYHNYGFIKWTLLSGPHIITNYIMGLSRKRYNKK